MAQALQAQLPPGLQLLGVEDCEVKKLDGSLSETIFKLMQTVEYHILVRQVRRRGVCMCGKCGQGL